MKNFSCCIVLALALVPIADDVAMAKTKPVIKPQKPRVAAAALVTRENFVSLTMTTSGGIANLRTEVVVRGRTITSTPSRHSSLLDSAFNSSADSGRGIAGVYLIYSPPRIAGMSEKQFDGLLNAFNQAHFEKLAGKYRQKNLADGINETLVLTISDDKDRDQRFVIENYGDTAPAAYFKFTAFLNDFVAMKFPQPAETAPSDSPPS